MLILLTIFLFLFIPLVMLILHWIWPRMNIQGFLALLVAVSGWILIFIARPYLAQSIPLLQWQPASLFLSSPALLLDSTSRYFALALASLALSVVISSITQLGYSPLPDLKSERQTEDVRGGIDPPRNSDQSLRAIINQGRQDSSSWQLWVSILALTGLGLLAVTAGNLLTVLLAWAALDIVELLVLLGQVPESKLRERIIVLFSMKMVGLCLTLVADIMLRFQGSPFLFEAISPSISTLLILAAGIRLGVLPLHLPFTKGLPVNRNLEMALTIIPSAANLILLVRVSVVGGAGTIAPIVIGFSVFAGVYAAVHWLRAKNEIEGGPYWLIGTASLAVIAATMRQPYACLAWGIASLLSGGLIYSLSLRHKNLIPIILLGIINLSALPFTPTWLGVGIYQFTSSLGISLTMFAFFSFFSLLIQSFILAGFIRFGLRGVLLERENAIGHTERWVWFLYPLGLIVLSITHFLIGWSIYPNLHEVDFSAWFIGPISLLITCLIFYFAWRNPRLLHPVINQNLRSEWDRVFSFEWLYRFLWRLFRTVLGIFSLVSRILEGDGGLLWALVLFGLIFVFMQK